MGSKVHPQPQDPNEVMGDQTPVEMINVESMETSNPVEGDSQTKGKPAAPVGLGIGQKALILNLSGNENLRGVDYVQLRQTNRHMEDFANVQNNYDVEKRDGNKIFYGIECTDPDIRAKVQSSTNASQPFALRIVDRDDGNEIIEVERQGINDAPTFVYSLRARQKTHYGGILLRFSWKRLTPTFTIFDKEGLPVMRLVGPTAPGLGKGSTAKTTTFTVFKGESTTKIGTIVKDGDMFQENNEPSTAEEIIRITYDDKLLPTMDKVLILCTAFTLDYTQFQEPSAWKKIFSLLCLRCC